MSISIKKSYQVFIKLQILQSFFTTRDKCHFPDVAPRSQHSLQSLQHIPFIIHEQYLLSDKRIRFWAPLVLAGGL